MDQKSIILVLSLCSSWGYSSKLRDLESMLEKELKPKYNVIFSEEPVSPGRGEYNIYLQKNGSKKLIFTNGSSNKESYTIMGNRIDETNVKELSKVIETLA